MEHPFSQLGSAALAVSPPKILLTLSLLAEGTEWQQEKPLTLCKHSLAVAKTLAYYLH